MDAIDQHGLPHDGGSAYGETGCPAPWVQEIVRADRHPPPPALTHESYASAVGDVRQKDGSAQGFVNSWIHHGVKFMRAKGAKASRKKASTLGTCQDARIRQFNRTIDKY